MRTQKTTVTCLHRALIFGDTDPFYVESICHRWIPTMASDAELRIFFHLRLIKQLSKQSKKRWVETPSRSLWHHCNAIERAPPSKENVIYWGTTQSVNERKLMLTVRRVTWNGGFHYCCCVSYFPVAFFRRSLYFLPHNTANVTPSSICLSTDKRLRT